MKPGFLLLLLTVLPTLSFGIEVTDSDIEKGSCSLLSPTVYYTPILKKNYRCRNKRGEIGRGIVSPGGKVTCNHRLIRRRVRNIEGAGVLLGENGALENVLQVGGTRKDREPITGMSMKDPSKCQVGYGTSDKHCLNPFKSVACPPGHPIGEVIQIKAAEGIEYPKYPGATSPGDMLVHDGLFYCVDRGSAITYRKGIPRFDFFTGLLPDKKEASWTPGLQKFFDLFSSPTRPVRYCKPKQYVAQRVLDENRYNTGELPFDVASYYSSPTILASFLDPNFVPGTSTVADTRGTAGAGAR